MAGRVSLAALLATTSLSGPTRVGASYVSSIIGLKGPTRVSAQYLIAAVGLRRPVRVSAQYMIAVQSVHRAIYPDLLDSTSLIYAGNTWAVETGSHPVPESNPYRPQIPEQLSGLGDAYYNYQSEQQQTLREQHNLTQAGDSTFPYQLLAETHSARQFTLGAIGRFFSEDYGLIHARYVQFDSMAVVSSLCHPVGLFKSATTLNWIVTNRLESSDPALVVGMTPQIKMPVDAEYGWVIVDGPNLQEAKNQSTTAKIGEAFTWSATGFISNTASGRIIGRRVNKKVDTRLAPGQLLVALESWSIGSIVVAVEELTANLATEVAALQADVSALQAASSVVATLQTLGNRLTALTSRIALEEKARAQADTSLRNSITGLPFATVTQLNQAMLAASTALSNLDSALGGRIDSVRTLAQTAYDLASSINFDPTFWNNQVTLILDYIDKIRKAPKGKFPIVDGMVPPNLVYLDDGSLVYEETF